MKQTKKTAIRSNNEHGCFLGHRSITAAGSLHTSGGSETRAFSDRISDATSAPAASASAQTLAGTTDAPFPENESVLVEMSCDDDLNDLLSGVGGGAGTWSTCINMHYHEVMSVLHLHTSTIYAYKFVEERARESVWGLSMLSISSGYGTYEPLIQQHAPPREQNAQHAQSRRDQLRISSSSVP